MRAGSSNPTPNMLAVIKRINEWHGDGTEFFVLDFVDLITDHNHPKDYVRQVFGRLEAQGVIMRIGKVKPPKGGSPMAVFKLTQVNLKDFKEGSRPPDKPLNTDEFNRACSKRLNDALNAAFKPNN